jgi:FAD/FMN-containing dehydrogenase
MKIKEELEKQIKGEVSDSLDVIKKFSTDASIFSMTPEVVVAPKDVDDISKIISFVSDKNKEGNRVSIVPRVGGTCMSGGALTESIVLDMTAHFNRIGEVDNNSKTITVQSGVYYRDMEKATIPSNLELASYTSSKNICGVGGMVGNNASGERSIKYGATSKQVESLRVILSDGKRYEFKPLSREELVAKESEDTFEGKLYREIHNLIDQNEQLIESKFPKVKKNAAGYALNEIWNKDKTKFNLGRIFVGSQATLGIIDDITFRLIPRIKYSAMLVIAINDLKSITPVVHSLLRSNSEVIETFDHHTYELAEEYLKEDAERAKLAKGKHLIVFGQFDGESEKEALEKAEVAKKDLLENGFESELVVDRDVVESFLAIRRGSFKMLLEHPHPNMRAAAFLEDTIVPIENYGEFLERLEEILADYKLTYTYAGHIGDGSIRLVPLVNFEKEGIKDEIMELSEKVYNLVFEFGGSMSVDHNDGLIRTVFLEKMYGAEMVSLFRRVKELFDPLNIFNQGKKVDLIGLNPKDYILTRNRS